MSTLVLLHALGLDRRMWDPVLPWLAAEREVVALDLPGFGTAPPLPGTVTPRDLAAAIAREHSGVHVAGNSLGGWVALEMALAGHARSVTAIAPAGLWKQPLRPMRSRARRAARALRPVLPLALRRDGARRAALQGTIAHPERVPYEAALGLVQAYAGAPGFDAVNDGMRANVFRGLDEITVPLTLAWPEHDRLVGRPDRIPPGAREFALRGCGHMPTWDDPEQVAHVLLEGSKYG